MSGTAFIDWLRFSFEGHRLGVKSQILREGVPSKQREARAFELMGEVLGAWLREWFGPSAMVVGEGADGMHGFRHSFRFYAWRFGESIQIGYIAWGGESQHGRVLVELNGGGCSLVKDWLSVYQRLVSLDVRLTRADVAVDSIDGQYIDEETGEVCDFTVDAMSDAYGLGEFNNGGRNPVFQVKGDWIHRQGLGRTMEVGRRQNGKVARVYEKGQQLGDRESPWVRFEVEIHNTDREVPHDIVLYPSKYFAGMFPVCARLVNAGSDRIETIQKEGEISLNRLTGYCKSAYGRLVHVMSFRGMSHAEIIHELDVEGVPRRLEKASLHAFAKSPEGASLGASQ